MPTMLGYMLEKIAIDEALEKALATPIEKKVADMMANSHEYKKPNIQGALTFVKNYTWEERTIPLSRLQGINKPIKKEKVFEIAKTLEKNGDTVEWPFIVVNKLHGIRPQTHGKVVLMDGHHRMEACKARGIKEVPVYFGVYTGGAEIEDDELYKEVPNEKIANILSKKDISIEDPGSNVTIVAGFSGSGKSTLSKRLAEETGAAHMDIDKAYSMLEDKPSYEDFLRSFVNNSHFSNGKIIIEGVGTSRLNEKDLKGKNVYIKGDGLLKSSLRRGYGENWDGEIGGVKCALSAFRVNKDMNKDMDNLRQVALQSKKEAQNEKTAKDYSEKLKNLRERKDPDNLNYPKRGEFREQCPKDKHAFIYQGGEARCEKCGWFVSPGGEMSKVASDQSLEKIAEDLIEKKIVTQDDLYTVARIVHEINRHYNRLLMDREDPSWDELKDKDKANRISLLSATVPDIKTISAKKMHDMWVDQQAKEGWVHGESYDAKKKTHPCIVSWKELPELEKAKDAMYLAVIKAMTELHFGIDKTLDSKIKEVKIPGGEKVLMNKSATMFGQLLEKQAGERRDRLVELSKMPLDYLGGYEGEVEGLDYENEEDLNEIEALDGDIYEALRNRLMQNSSAKKVTDAKGSATGRLIAPIFLGGVGGGVAGHIGAKNLGNKLIDNALSLAPETNVGKAGKAAAILGALGARVGGDIAGTIGGSTLGGVAGGFLGTQISPYAFKNVTEEDIRAYNEEVQKFRESELPALIASKGYTLKKQAADDSYLKDFVAGMDPTGVSVFRRAMNTEDNHAIHRGVADASGFISGAVTGGAIPGVLLGGASLAMKKKNPHLSDELRIMAGGALDTYNPKKVVNYIRSFKDLGKFKDLGRDLMTTSKDVTKNIDSVVNAKGIGDFSAERMSTLGKDYGSLRNAQDNMDKLTEKMRTKYFNGRPVDEGMSRAMSAVTGLGMAGVSGGINAGSSHLQYNTALAEKEKQRALKTATMFSELLEKEAEDKKKSEITNKEIAGGIAALVGAGTVKSQMDNGNLSGREKLYHGTKVSNIKSILENGIIAPQGELKPKSVTEVMVNSRRLDPNDFLNKTYMGTKPAVANSVTNMATINEMNNVNFDNSGLKGYLDAYNDTKSGIVVGKVPTWKMNITGNPEIGGARSAAEYHKIMTDSDGILDAFPEGSLMDKLQRMQTKSIYKTLGEQTRTFEGDVPAEFLKGKNYKRETVEELLDYIKSNPKRFGKGALISGAGAAGIAGGGYLLSDRINELLNKEASELGKRSLQQTNNIRTSANAGRMLELKYKDKSGNISTRFVEPYKLTDDDFWGYDPEQGGIRRFKIKNIKAVKKTTKPFTPQWPVEMESLQKAAMATHMI